MNWGDLIQQTKVSDLVAAKEQQHIVIIKAGTTLGDALHILKEHSILSAPVVDYVHKKTLGFVDVLDIAGFVLNSWRNLYTDERNYARDEFFREPIEHVINYAKCDYIVSIPDSKSVKEIIDVFCDPQRYSRQHRIAVTNSTGIMSNIISQSDIITFTSKNISSLSIGDKSVQSLGLVHACIMVRIDSPFYSTLEILCRNKISGMALTDDQGRLSANFSASDLRGITQNAFGIFTHSTLQFLVKGTESSVGPPVSCTADTTLKAVIEIMATQQLHRIYVADENSRPIGIITMSDIIHLLKFRPNTRELVV